ncbi:MAG: GNAT family N-acetyltransferase [Solirubrobacterales bacterium]
MSAAAPRARAELIEDGGAAAASPDFFRSPQFLAAENATHTLRIETEEGAELLAPLLVRAIGAGPERDATSPYGFPGLVSPAGVVVDPAAIDFSATGLVSVFFRHRIGEPPLAGATPRNVVEVADPALPRKSRPSDRRQIRRNLEAGYGLELVPGGETSAAQRAGFVDLYEQTMRRTEAAEHYFFGQPYFDRVLAAERTWLALATDPGGELAAASLAAVSDGYLHYYLSASADARLADSPMKNVVALLVDHAEGLGMPLNLGGGISRGDALEEFKRGFANREEQWTTSEVVCDSEAYERLSRGRDASGYFPAYRAP